MLQPRQQVRHSPLLRIALPKCNKRPRAVAVLLEAVRRRQHGAAFHHVLLVSFVTDSHIVIRGPLPIANTIIDILLTADDSALFL